MRAGSRARAGLRRLKDVIHLAIDVPATEEKQRKRGERERSGNDCEIEDGNGLHDLSGCWVSSTSALYPSPNERTKTNIRLYR